MNDARWMLLGVLAILGYAQRGLPWIFAERLGLGPGLTRWLQHVAPAAFATLLVYDIGPIDGSTFVALGLAGLVAWRTRNLGGAVFAAMGVKILWVVMARG